MFSVRISLSRQNCMNISLRSGLWAENKKKQTNPKSTYSQCCGVTYCKGCSWSEHGLQHMMYLSCSTWVPIVSLSFRQTDEDRGRQVRVLWLLCWSIFDVRFTYARRCGRSFQAVFLAKWVNLQQWPSDLQDKINELRQLIHHYLSTKNHQIL